MLRLPPFELLRPATASEAAGMLAELDGRAMAVAGGTDLYPKMKRRQFEPTHLVALRGIAELQGVNGSGASGLSIGAGVPLSRVAGHLDVGRHYGGLAVAAGLVSTPQLRSMGTIGGNLAVDTRCNYYDMPFGWRQSVGFCLKKDGDRCLVAPSSPRCWAISSSDTAPILIALGARVTLVGPEGTREIAAGELYRNDGADYLTKRPHEIITRISLPPADGVRSTYLKLRRRGSFDFPILGVAVALWLDGDIVTDARIVLGAVASHPVEAVVAERVLAGNRLTPEVLREAADRAGDPAKPLDNADLAHYWRKRMSRVFVRRALAQLVELPSGQDVEAGAAAG